MAFEISNEPERPAITRRVWFPWAALVCVLLVGGAGYRVFATHFLGLSAKKIVLPVPLAGIPKEIGDWRGEDRDLTPEVVRIAGNDDTVNRVYANAATGEVAGFYIAYSARPRTMVGHRPQVCYTNAGWILDGTVREELTLPDGRRLPVLVHRFHEVPPKYGAVVVLNYYILNGVTTNDESSFAGFGWRLPNIEGNPAWYVAQVQIASVSESAVRSLALATAREALDFLPDRQGNVAVAARHRPDAPGDASADGGGQ